VRHVGAQGNRVWPRFQLPRFRTCVAPVFQPPHFNPVPLCAVRNIFRILGESIEEKCGNLSILNSPCHPAGTRRFRSKNLFLYDILHAFCYASCLHVLRYSSNEKCTPAKPMARSLFRGCRRAPPTHHFRRSAAFAVMVLSPNFLSFSVWTARSVSTATISKNAQPSLMTTLETLKPSNSERTVE
jgi:hypothetical protein